MPVLRTKSVGTKVTDGEYAMLDENIGAPCRTRTCDLLVRSQTLYPTELRARGLGGIVGRVRPIRTKYEVYNSDSGSGLTRALNRLAQGQRVTIQPCRPQAVSFTGGSAESGYPSTQPPEPSREESGASETSEILRSRPSASCQAECHLRRHVRG